MKQNQRIKSIICKIVKYMSYQELYKNLLFDKLNDEKQQIDHFFWCAVRWHYVVVPKISY